MNIKNLFTFSLLFPHVNVPMDFLLSWTPGGVESPALLQALISGSYFYCTSYISQAPEAQWVSFPTSFFKTPFRTDCSFSFPESDGPSVSAGHSEKTLAPCSLTPIPTVIVHGDFIMTLIIQLPSGLSSLSSVAPKISRGLQQP